VRQIVRSSRNSIQDQRADEIAVLALLDEIDRRRRTFFAAADVAQIDRLPQPALRLADQYDRLALAREGEGCRLGEVVEDADTADRRRRQNRAAVGLVVERHVP